MSKYARNVLAKRLCTFWDALKAPFVPQARDDLARAEEQHRGRDKREPRGLLSPNEKREYQRSGEAAQISARQPARSPALFPHNASARNEVVRTRKALQDLRLSDVA